MNHGSFSILCVCRNSFVCNKKAIMHHADLNILKTITREDQYTNIIALLNHSKDPKDYSLVAKWSEDCFNEINDWETILAAIDQELKTKGVECIYDNDTSMPLVSYCNTDDPYGITVMYDHTNKKFFVGSWASAMEAVDSENLDSYLAD
jgi:hypothetical protein